MEQTLLSIEHLKKSYDDNLILDDINLEVHQGEVIVLVGPSGCGKSTMLRCINALEPIQEGEIKLNGEKIDEEIDLKSEEILIDTLDYSAKEIKKVKKNKFIIILLTIVITILSIVILDTIQAIVFKNSPIISWRIEDANDSDSYVDKGILIDTYYCVSDDVITVIPTFKNTNYNCPSE